ncbi:MAG: hypothetical protein ACTHMY_19625 [Solirubrobacteraceae bacterium]
MPNAKINPRVTRRRLVSGVVAVSCAAATGACGASSMSTDPPASRDPAVAVAQCLRGHGVPNFPDPSPGAPPRIPSSINAEAPAFKAAQAACAGLLKAGGESAWSPASRRLQLLALASCMRRHGIPNFADPTNSPPPPGRGNVMGADGVYLAVGPPASQRSPAFRAAADTCHLP